MAIPTLPFEIITDILTRLPSKTLIRFKSVSKQWYSLINSPHFINLHLTQTLISNKSPNLILPQYTLSSVTISDENNPNFHLIELDHPLKHPKSSSYDREFATKIIGSINGVVCISFYNKDTVVLYNPSTKTHRFVPPFTPTPYTNPNVEMNTADNSNANVVLFALGFDSVRGDYKLLRMIETRKKHVMVYREASVYSLKNDSWKCVSDQLIKGQFFFQSSMGVFLNEVLHFISVDRKFVLNVECFNLRNETFSIFDLPMLDESFRRNIYAINVLGGCLSVMVNYLKSKADDCALVQADLWVMKEYGNKESWFRLFCIRDPARFEVLSHFKPVLYSRDKKRVLLELDYVSFGWYSWGSETFERITVHGWPSVYAPCETWTFVDSLVSVKKDNVKDKSKPIPKKNRNKMARDGFLSSGFKLRL